MNNSIKRKTPEELISKAKRPLSSRIDVRAYKALEQIAKKLDTSLSDLSAGILEDYVHWYEQEGREPNKKNTKK
ncbi:MAG: hypothetical protein K2P81_00580 [Bacteriovoracaceae bacterium]|nr:hypothetical protein [Bacteriovoracaceae bacterium]